MLRSRWCDLFWLLALGVASSAWCVTAAAQLGATFDEPFYLDKGLHHWRTGSYKPLMTAGTMPLPVDVETLPVYLWERHRGVPFQPYAAMPEILPVARAANLLFWWLLLGYSLALGRALGGPWAGRLAAGFIACEPSLLAHAALATTDIAVTAGVLAAAYHFHAGQGKGWGKRVLVPGLCYGVAILAKASALAFVPLVYVAFALHRLAAEGQLSGTAGLSLGGRIRFYLAATSRLRWDLAAIGVIGLAVVFLYCGSDWEAERTFVEWAANLPNGPAKSALLLLAENLRVFTNAGEGLMQQVKHNFRGHGSYIVGVRSPRAVWWYFPVLFSAKLTLPVLGLLLAIAVTRPWALASPAGLATLALLLFSLNCRVQIGIRLQFPLVALLLITLAVALCRRPNPPVASFSPLLLGEGPGVGLLQSNLTPQPPSLRGKGEPEPVSLPRLGVGVGFLVLLAMVGIAAWVWPHGISYTNQLWGGPAEGYRVAADSNYDWGQGLPEVKAWHEVHGGGGQLALWYYGGDPAFLFPPFRTVNFHHHTITNGDDVRRLCGTRYLAVGTTLLTSGPARNPSAQATLDWLATRTPVARTTTFFIYSLE